MTQPAASASAAPVREGDILAGKYRVERVLGAGGMGVVVAAMHLQLDQRVALKFVLPEAITSQEAIERFSREARAAAKLKSDHVARVIDVGTLENGAPYMVMEYLDGCDLSQYVDRVGPLPCEEAADFILQACEAMAEAHAIGIVHRDLKPQNLFLTTRVDGRALIKVLDFGISKFTPSGNSGENMSLTRTQAVMGSPNYMSPEQLRSAKMVDARTDIWALGVILYELLSGKVPFQATSVTELCAMVLQDTPRPMRSIRPDVPDGLAEVVARCLEKDPALRFQSIASLAHALEVFGRGQSMGAGQRILAVARGSSARSVAPPPYDISASQQVPVVVAPGGTSVSWGETELASGGPRMTMPPRSRMLVPVLVGVAGLSAILMGLAIFFAVKMFRHPLADNTPTAQTQTQGAAPPPVTSLPPSMPSAPLAQPSPIAVAPPSSRPLPASPGVVPPKPPAPIHGVRPPTRPHAPDTDTPDERN